MSEFIKKPRNVVFSFFTLAVLCLLVVWYVPSKRAHALLGGMPDDHTFARTLIHAGLDVDALAAAGLTSYDVDDVIGDATQYILASPQSIETLQSDVDQLNIQVDALRRTIRSGLATQDDLDTYAQAAGALATAQAALDTYLDGLFAAATLSLTQGQQDCLASIRSNDAWRSLYNLELLTVDRSEPQWVELRDCLANERIAYDNGENPDGYCQAVLTTARANPNVSSAAAYHQANYANVAYAWNAAIFN